MFVSPESKQPLLARSSPFTVSFFHRAADYHIASFDSPATITFGTLPKEAPASDRFPSIDHAKLPLQAADSGRNHNSPRTDRTGRSIVDDPQHLLPGRSGCAWRLLCPRLGAVSNVMQMTVTRYKPRFYCHSEFGVYSGKLRDFPKGKTRCDARQWHSSGRESWESTKDLSSRALLLPGVSRLLMVRNTEVLECGLGNINESPPDFSL